MKMKTKMMIGSTFLIGVGLVQSLAAMMWNLRHLNQGLGSLSAIIRGFTHGTPDACRWLDGGLPQ